MVTVEQMIEALKLCSPKAVVFLEHGSSDDDEPGEDGRHRRQPMQHIARDYYMTPYGDCIPSFLRDGPACVVLLPKN